MTGSGRQRPSPGPLLQIIPTAGLSSSGMTVPVTRLSITRRHLTGSSRPTTGCCAAQSSDSFLGSRRSCQVRRVAQSAMTCRSRSTWGPAASCALRTFSIMVGLARDRFTRGRPRKAGIADSTGHLWYRRIRQGTAPPGRVGTDISADQLML